MGSNNNFAQRSSSGGDSISQWSASGSILGVTGILGFFHDFHTAPVRHLPVLSRDMQHVSSFLHGGLDGGTL